MMHPYRDAPDYRWWRTMANTPAADVDPVIAWPFTISRSDRIVTAGSCFAQHMSRHLQACGFTHLVTEPAHPILPEDTAAACHYGVYSARYGNVYTSRQLLQLLRRAYGRFTPAEDMWEHNGRYLDPFRPQIQPNGFATWTEYQADRRQHFAAVRRAFEAMDVFVFTLGLTECWTSRVDGAVYPLCPGVAGGIFDPERHAFLNLSVEQVTADMQAFIDELRTINATAKVIVSVSPVPPVATAEDRHVLVSAAYTQAVLRVAAEALTRLPDVAYFPAYELIVGAASRGGYFADDLRSIREDGVAHVMRVFFRHATSEETSPADMAPRADGFLQHMQDVVDALCDDDALAREQQARR